MSVNQEYSCTSELGAEFLLVFTSIIIAICTLIPKIIELDELISSKKHKAIVEPIISLFLSLSYALFIPLSSYLFAQANQFQKGRAQVILTWMVFVEMINIYGDHKFTWRLRKSVEQLVRIFWVSYLIYSYSHLNGIRVNLFILCVYYVISEIFRGIHFNKAKNSYLIGRNPELIHNYMKKMMPQEHFKTTPMKECDYIVMGEEYHKVDMGPNGYILGKRKNESVGVLTIGRVFQLNSSEDEEFTSVHPSWRDTCLSFALAKMLRCRFAMLPVVEAESKALDFVLEWINVYINGSTEERKPAERVFHIIENELKIVSELSYTRKPLSKYYLDEYRWVDMMGFFIFLGSGIYLIDTISKRRSKWESQLVTQAGNSCVFHTFRGGVDLIITILLIIACSYMPGIRTIGFENETEKWDEFDFVRTYIKDPKEWLIKRHKNTSTKDIFLSLRSQLGIDDFFRSRNFKQVHFSSLFELNAKSLIWHLPRFIRRNLALGTSTRSQSTEAKESILRYLRKSEGQLSNGNSSLRGHKMERLNWAIGSNWSNTESILIWHIATTLFHYHETATRESTDSHQEPSPEKNKEREVALELSSYCHKLVVYRPELLPDAVDWTEKIYENVRNEILNIDQSYDQKPIKQFFSFVFNILPQQIINGFTVHILRRQIKDRLELTKDFRCNYALEKPMDQNSLIGKGSKLAKDLVSCAQDGAHMWPMLADFWAEMLLFVAPSDNVEAHKEILERGELITQLWALLTHAGIIARPKQTQYDNHGISENNEIARDDNHEIIENDEIAEDHNQEITENNELAGDMNV